MKINNKSISFRKIIILTIYYTTLRYLPSSTFPIAGRYCKLLRYYCCRSIFKKCGKNVNIERMAFFGTGLNIEIGDHSGLGINCNIPSNTKIGDYVMMGPNCYILGQKHYFNSTEKPMMFQGTTGLIQTTVEDDVWIGRNVTILPGMNIKKGSIVGACCLLTKNYPEFSIIGGNPSILIKRR